jgi:hypothetical protein
MEAAVTQNTTKYATLGCLLTMLVIALFIMLLFAVEIAKGG